jgi:hypothetical protein
VEALRAVGSFYANLTIVGPAQEDVLAAVPPPAWVGPTIDAATVVFPPDDTGDVSEVAAHLSAALSAPVLETYVHDDDLLGVRLWIGGAPADDVCVPDPAEYFDLDPDEVGDSAAPGHDPVRLVEALGRGDVNELERALATDFVFATDRHTAVATALNLPTAAAGWGFRYLEREADTYSGPALTRV